MARLLPMSRFLLLGKDGLHYSEGLAIPGYKEGGVDPSAAIRKKDTKILWTDPEKRPWRSLTSLLSFLGLQNQDGFDCLQLQNGIRRIIKHNSTFGIWAGGLQVKNTTGEQKVSGSSDYVESQVMLNSAMLTEEWFGNLSLEMTDMDSLSSNLYGSVVGFFNDQKAARDGKKIAGQATNVYWQQCEHYFQRIVNACDSETQEELYELRKKIIGIVLSTYDQFCPHNTARQLELWAKNRPQTGWYSAKRKV